MNDEDVSFGHPMSVETMSMRGASVRRKGGATYPRVARGREERMADFVLLYRGGSAAETDEERAAQMEAWTSWFGSLGSAVVDGGNPFTETAAHVRADGSVGSVPAAGIATGFSILRAD